MFTDRDLYKFHGNLIAPFVSNDNTSHYASPKLSAEEIKQLVSYHSEVGGQVVQLVLLSFPCNWNDDLPSRIAFFCRRFPIFWRNLRRILRRFESRFHLTYNLPTLG